MISLNGNLNHTAGLHHVQEITVADGDFVSAGLLEYLEQHDHHEADDQPESKVFIEWIQLKKSSANVVKIL